MSITNWVANKLAENTTLKIVGRTLEDYLIIEFKGNYTFVAAVLGSSNVIDLSDVVPLFSTAIKPQFVVNGRSSQLWSGVAINYIHAQSAAFGTLGYVVRAAATGDVGSYRDKEMGFFINAMKQHKNVANVSYIFNNVFRADRKVGTSLIVAVIDAYNMSAEDVRNAKTRLGNFDVVVRSTSYGSVTSQAEEAAKSIGAQALTFRQLLGRLA